jgi:transcriptional regulator with XRE-family HTH domain
MKHFNLRRKRSMKTIYDPKYRRMIQEISARRRALGKDQRTVAAKLGHTNRWLSKVERLDVRLDVCQFVRLCGVLRLDAGRLVRRLAEESADEGEPSFTYRMGSLLFRDAPGSHQSQESLPEVLGQGLPCCDDHLQIRWDSVFLCASLCATPRLGQ